MMTFPDLLSLSFTIKSLTGSSSLLSHKTKNDFAAPSSSFPLIKKNGSTVLADYFLVCNIKSTHIVSKVGVSSKNSKKQQTGKEYSQIISAGL